MCVCVRVRGVCVFMCFLDRFITASTRLFEKPQMNAKRVCFQSQFLHAEFIVMQTYAPITADKVDSYQVDPSIGDAKNFELHQMFSKLQLSEATSLTRVRASEEEVCVCVCCVCYVYVCVCV
jgi:hypothetical protein